VSSGEQTSLRAILQAIGIETVVTEPASGRVLGRMALSPSRARLHLGWAPWTTVPQGIESTLSSAG
jgi:nucleoside-diphosphate-sugar epimerase